MKMERLPKFFILVFVTTLLMITMAFISSSPKRVVFLGDSVTQMGAEPGGYIDLMRGMLKAKNLGGKFDLMGSGIGGNKVYDLYQRLEKDVLSKKPDIVFVFVGVNDVLHKTWGKDVDAGKFELFYRALIRKVKASGAEVILCTPAVIGERTDFSNAHDGDLNKYATIVLGLSKEEKCTLLDLRAMFLKYNLSHNPNNLEQGILTTDGVHLNPTGNKLVADAMMEVLLGR